MRETKLSAILLGTFSGSPPPVGIKESHYWASRSVLPHRQSSCSHTQRISMQFFILFRQNFIYLRHSFDYGGAAI